MSPLSPTQKGIIAEQEFAKLLMLGSDGDLEVARPLADDERRDLEAHRRGHFTSLAFQVKSTTYLEHRYRARHFSVHILVERDRVINDPRFWYFFAYLDLAAMAFGDPVFLVPSAEVHTHAVRTCAAIPGASVSRPVLPPGRATAGSPTRLRPRTSAVESSSC